MGLVKHSILLVAAFVSVIHAYPAKPSEEVEFVSLPADSSRPARPQLPGFSDSDFFGGADEDASFFPNPFYFTSGLYDNIAAMLARLRAQLASATPRFPEIGDSGITFPNLNLPGIGDVDLGKGNTTSVTKIIDGKKVVINETEYKKEGDLGGAYFKVRIIDMRPAEEDESTEKAAEPSRKEITSEPTREVEALEDSLENEIPKNKEGSPLRYENLESFDNVDFAEDAKQWKPLESFDYNGLEQVQPYRDLSNDIYVNQLMADSGAPTNPDAEIIDDIDNQMFVKDLRRRM